MERTIKLTDEQFNIVLQALGIAEKKFNDIHKDIVDNTIVVRGVDDETNTEQRRIANFYFVKACEIADITLAMKNTYLDV